MEGMDFLPLVKAYPALSKTYGEVSCIAGVEMTASAPRWIRLYPVPFRALGDEQQFRKYQPIRVRVEEHSGDRRPETRRPDRDSIAVIGDQITSKDGWAQRRRFVEPLMVTSMCEILRRQKIERISLGAFRPKRVIDLVIEKRDISQEKQQIAQAWAAQPSLLDGLAANEKGHQLRELELIPWTFKYKYECDEQGCGTHTQSIIDWEIAGYYRRVRNFVDWQERMKAHWVGKLCGSDRDTAFFVGNQHQHLNSFLVLGVWWPELRAEQLALGNLGDV